MPLDEVDVSQLLTPSGVVALAALTVKASGNPELDSTVSDRVGAAAPVRKATGLSVFTPPFTTSVGAAPCTSSVTVTLMPVLPAETILTLVVFSPAPSVVHPGLTENVIGLSPGVVSAVPAMGVTSSQGTVGGVTVK